MRSFAGSSVPACGLNTTFSHQVFSPCVEQSHYVDNLQSVPEVFSTNACTTDQTTTTTSDWTGRDCPHNNNSNAVIVGGDDDDDDDNNSDLSSVLPSDSSSSGIRVDLDYTFMCTSSLVCLFILAARQFG
ncbi:hypothetical protein FRACYDRAFT_239585 [Fragilariopsis cylindrus CCMP1102]|uniref:Uncharacterized protein n=1 Tax=Fragilariopsis cylindrus CCMP1102 TaxID=635003 RepID=A0A1E7FFP3_9STRA|nr:hypothetical protein FRACYDRAFT_239585 [Fragilariopsis cylindrus CCMP1102]|eukprot:OEU16988.1 hypothetical protein FRACYDRAFT_239585 [Fragilariopsis cylindrus CCMP1102]